MVLKPAPPKREKDRRRATGLKARLFPKRRRREKRQLAALRKRSEQGAPLRGEDVVMPEDRNPRRVTFEPRESVPDRPPALRRRSPTPPAEKKGKGKGKSKGKGKGKSKKGKDKAGTKEGARRDDGYHRHHRDDWR